MKPSVTITKGSSGWGGPLTVYETETRKVVASVTGGSIHPLAEKIASLLGVPVVDAFNNKVEPDTIIIAVVDCGGTLRCGVYPKMGVKTIDIHPISRPGRSANISKKIILSPALHWTVLPKAVRLFHLNLKYPGRLSQNRLR